MEGLFKDSIYSNFILENFIMSNGFYLHFILGFTVSWLDKFILSLVLFLRRIETNNKL